MSVHLGVFRALGMLAGYRSRLWEGVLTDIRVRYVGSVFGLAWNVIFPIAQLGLYTVIYVYIFKIRPASLTEYQYVALVFSGLVPLLSFNEALMSATSSLTAHRSLLFNTVFPAELLPVRAAVATQVPTLIAMLVTLTAGYALSDTNWRAPLLVPVLWLLLLMSAIGVGWILSLVSLVARDIQHGLGLVMLALFILSPFAYTPDMVPEGLRAILYFNPLSYYVLAFQQVICYGRWPDTYVLATAVTISMVTFFAGFAFFRRAKFAFFDYA